MVPFLFLVGAGLALFGCAGTARERPESSSPPPPPRPPTPDCTEAAGVTFAAPELFPCPQRPEWRGAPYFASLPNSQDWSSKHKAYLSSIGEYIRRHGVEPSEVIELARKVRTTGPDLALTPGEKTQALGLAAVLLAARKMESGFFHQRSGEWIDAVLENIRDGKLKMRILKQGETPPGSYSLEEDAVLFNPFFADSLSPEVEQNMLGALFDFSEDLKGTPVSGIDHAFERSTLQALFGLESAGRDLSRMSPEQLDSYIAQVKGSEAGLQGAALRAFYCGLNDVTKRYDQMKLFASLYEERRLGEDFKSHYDRAAKDFHFQEDWHEVLKENRTPKPIDARKLATDIQRLDKDQQKQWADFKREAQKAAERTEAEDRKSKLMFRSPTHEEVQAGKDVRKRFDALIHTWSALIYLRTLEKNSRYTIQETGPALRPEDELIRALVPFGILGKEKIPFNGVP